MKAFSLALAVLLGVNSPAKAGDVTGFLLKKLQTDKVFAPQCKLLLFVGSKQALLSVLGYEKKSDQAEKVDAVLAARTLITAEPPIACVVVRFRDNSGYTDAIVTARQIVGFGAGTINKDTLLSSISCVYISTSDTPEQVFGKYIQEAERALKAGEFGECEQLCALAVPESGGWPEASHDPRPFECLLQVAEAYHSREDAAGTERVYRRMLSFADPTKKSEPEVLKVYLQLADLYLEEQRPKEAMALLEQIVHEQEGHTDVAYAALLEKLATLYTYHDEAPKAEDLLKRSISIREKLSGEDPALAQTLEKLGDAYAQGGQQSAAKPLYLHAKEICDRAVVTKDKGKRMSYEVYSAMVKRLESKLASGSSH